MRGQGVEEGVHRIREFAAIIVFSTFYEVALVGPR